MDGFRATTETFRSGSRSLPGPYYHGDSIFREEQEKIFLRDWICVGRAEEAPQPGDYFLAEVAGESLIFVRGADGALRAFHNLCRHRGTALCQAAKGSLPGRIQCPYHGWTYSLAGALVSAPLMNEVAGFDPAERHLIEAALEICGGFVFVSLADAPAPFEAAVGRYFDRMANWDLAGLACGHREDYEVAANWKLVIENYSECYHCPLVHPLFTRHVHVRSGHNDSFEGRLLGGFMELADGTESLTPDGRHCGAPLEGLRPEDRSRVYFYALFPSLTISLHPDYVMTFIATPLAPDRTLVRCEFLFPRAALADGACRPAEATAFWDRTNKEDWTVCGLVQKGVRSRRYQPSPLSNTESLPEAFNRQVLAALA